MYTGILLLFVLNLLWSTSKFSLYLTFSRDFSMLKSIYFISFSLKHDYSSSTRYKGARYLFSLFFMNSYFLSIFLIKKQFFSQLLNYLN